MSKVYFLFMAWALTFLPIWDTYYWSEVAQSGGWGFLKALIAGVVNLAAVAGLVYMMEHEDEH